jgi:hypothetical protein
MHNAFGIREYSVNSGLSLVILFLPSVWQPLVSGFVSLTISDLFTWTTWSPSPSSFGDQPGLLPLTFPLTFTRSIQYGDDKDRSLFSLEGCLLSCSVAQLVRDMFIGAWRWSFHGSNVAVVIRNKHASNLHWGGCIGRPLNRNPF